MTISRRVVNGGIAMAALAGLAGCGGGPRAAKPTPAFLLINADAAINPNESGDPSPVVVRVYELKGLKAFDNADYFDFVDNDTQTLGADLIASTEYEMTPGKEERYDREISGEATYLGVVAGFRNIQSAQWRTSIELKKGRKNQFVINLTGLSVSIEDARGRRRRKKSE